jgi:hypothetical protein
MERRFALDASKMTVSINGAQLKRFDVPVDVRFPRDGQPARSGAELVASRHVSRPGTARRSGPRNSEPDASVTGGLMVMRRVRGSYLKLSVLLMPGVVGSSASPNASANRRPEAGSSTTRIGSSPSSLNALSS